MVLYSPKTSGSDRETTVRLMLTAAGGHVLVACEPFFEQLNVHSKGGADFGLEMGHELMIARMGESGQLTPRFQSSSVSSISLLAGKYRTKCPLDRNQKCLRAFLGQGRFSAVY